MLTDKEITEILIEYIKEKRYTNAILIDGDWGTGKTFFIKKILLKELKKNVGKKDRCLYVSLYGIEDVVQISSKIYAEILVNSVTNFFEDKIKKTFIYTGIKLATKLSSTFESWKGIRLPSLKDIINIKNCIIIFDDIERANMDINKILGYVNDLVEHNEVKAILVANEKEIIENEKYIKIKEKLIGKTIKYAPKLSIVYKNILECYIKNNIQLMEYLNKEEQKKLILNDFTENNHFNLRTLVYSLVIYEKFFEILKEIDFDLKYIEKHKSRILKYTIYLSIQMKLQNKIEDFSNLEYENKMGNIFLKDNINKSIYGYRFIYIYFSTGGYLDKRKIKEALVKEMEKEKSQDEEIEKINTKSKKYEKLSFNTLKDNWWNLDDEEIYIKLNLMKKELKDNEYHPASYKWIVIMLLQLEYEKFDNITTEEFINLMKLNLNSEKTKELHGEVYKKEYFDVIIENIDFRTKYNDSVKELIDIVIEKNKEEGGEKKEFFLENEKWDSDFITICSKWDEKLLILRKFFSFVDIDKMIKRLKEVDSPKDIYYLIDGIRRIYSFSNIEQYYKEDIQNIKLFLEKLEKKLLEISQGIKTREIALKALQKNLKEYLSRLER